MSLKITENNLKLLSSWFPWIMYSNKLPQVPWEDVRVDAVGHQIF